jgi:hypothetical protein
MKREKRGSFGDHIKTIKFSENEAQKGIHYVKYHELCCKEPNIFRTLSEIILFRFIDKEAQKGTIICIILDSDQICYTIL